MDNNNNESNNNSESGKTYWEAGGTEQNLAPGPESKAPDTPEQFYQNYQQQMGGNTYSPQQMEMTHLEPARKKPRKKLTAAIIVILLLLTVSATAYAFRDRLMNSFALMTKSPEEYYAYVENRYIGKNADALVESMEGYDQKQAQDMAYRVAMDLTYDKETVSSLLQPSLGMSIADLESFIGLPLDSIGMDMTVALKDSDIYEKAGISLNKVNLITAELFLDSLGREMLIRLPELSPAYLRQSLDMEGLETTSFDFGGYEDQMELIYSDETSDFIKRYAKIATSQIKDVKLNKNEELSIDKLSADCTLLTVTIDPETAKDIADKVLKEAEGDEYILELLPMFSTTEEDYLAGIEEARDNLETHDWGDGNTIMKVYVDGSGNILGRKFEFDQDGEYQGELGFSKLGKKNNEEYEIYCKDEDGNELFSVTGSHIVSEDAYDGKAKVNINSGSTEGISFTVGYEDARSESVGNQKFAYGTYTVSSPSMLGAEIVLEMDVDDDVQQIDLSLHMGSSEMVTLHITSEQLKNYEIPVPDETAEVYDLLDSESYAATFDMDAYIADLSEKLGVDVQSIIDIFMNTY